MSRLMSSTHAAFPSGGLSQWPSGRMRTGLSRGLYTGISLAAGRGNWLSFAVIWFDGESLGWTIRIKMDLWWWSAVFHPLDDRMTTSTGKWYWAGFDGWESDDDEDLTYRDANGGMTDVPDTRRYKNKNNQKIQITRQRCCGGGGILISCSWVELWYIYYTLSWMMNGYTRLFDIRTSQDGCVFALLPVFCEALMSPATSVLPGII